MPKIPARVLGGVAGAALALHALRSIPAFREAHFPDGHGELGALLLGPPLLQALFGRLVLAFLPPGEPGPGGLRGAAFTWGTSLALGLLVLTPLQRLGARPGLLPVAIVLLALLRWTSRPGKMVPRHAPRPEPWSRADTLALLPLLAWSVMLLRSSAAWTALGWMALAAIVLHALDTTRRARAGRWLLLGFLLLPGEPTGFDHPDAFAVVLGPALSTTLGVAFALPWIRRADRRAAVLSSVGFASLLLEGFDPLALLGPLLVCAFVHRRQRLFTLAAGALAAPWFLLPRWLAHTGASPPRGRPLDLAILRDSALLPETWGLAWVALALVPLLALRAWSGPWKPGTIEEPRREALFCALLLIVAAALEARPGSPWFENQVLVRLAPTVALLVGLLTIPSAAREVGGTESGQDQRPHTRAYARAAGTETHSSVSGA